MVVLSEAAGGALSRRRREQWLQGVRMRPKSCRVQPEVRGHCFENVTEANRGGCGNGKTFWKLLG